MILNSIFSVMRLVDDCLSLISARSYLSPKFYHKTPQLWCFHVLVKQHVVMLEILEYIIFNHKKGFDHPPKSKFYNFCRMERVLLYVSVALKKKEKKFSWSL